MGAYTVVLISSFSLPSLCARSRGPVSYVQYGVWYIEGILLRQMCLGQGWTTAHGQEVPLCGYRPYDGWWIFWVFCRLAAHYWSLHFSILI
ncbi:uncharacterized protein BDW47DRAFT_42772 [Aspergillus candidus]|uniref:Secreted protein n=1 Tax=Aspergillus candidus TaxID=41067 RepID=A0A2I2FMQ2_ASPCN|nr:hypothetical protein BDW47DRAFT_42772 [Aspergillus candidus]PLB41913.1 hypothetical protein BDW47DRAFT_42772 [Aspergillus candidus]